MSSNIVFPSPVGGVPFQADFVPSVLFAVLYGLLIPVVVTRLSFKRYRTLVTFGTFSFAVERVAIFALRAEQSRNDGKRVSGPLTTYMQMSWAIGFVSIASDLLQLLRSLVVNATLRESPIGPTKSDTVFDSETAKYDIQLDERTLVNTTPIVQSSSESTGRERERHEYRRLCGTLALLYWIPFILGIISGSLYDRAERSSSQAQLVQHLRYASTGLAFFFILVIQCFSIYAVCAIRNIEKKPTLVIAGLSTLLNVVSIYRLIVMRFHTTSLTSYAPGSLNGTGSHVCFYVIHIAPEFVAAATILGLNARVFFGTGLYGDSKYGKKEEAESTGSS